MMRSLKMFCLLAAIALTTANGQAPTPIIVQAASAIPAKSNSSGAIVPVSSLPDAIKTLEEVKAANDEILAKQKAALERLDELQEAADQLRIFAKRG